MLPGAPPLARSVSFGAPAPTGTMAPRAEAGRREVAPYRVLAGQSRQALLAALQSVDGPLDAAAAGAAVGLHPNTARVHLDLLCSAGFVRRRAEDRSTRGRPRVLYEVAGAAGSVLDGKQAPDEAAYRELARLLAHQFSELPDASTEAARAGRRWADLLDTFVPSPTQLPAREAIEALTELLSRLGFHPSADMATSEIRLERCPFLDVARESAAVICGVHLGMLRAALERLNAPFEVVGLEPLVIDDPSMCIVRLAEHALPEPGAAP